MSLLICRVCLNRNVKLNSIADHKLLQIFAVLASCELNGEDGMPTTVCYTCVSQLRRCRRFFDMVNESTSTLKQLLQNGIEISQGTSLNTGAKHHFVAKTLPQVSLVDNLDHTNDLAEAQTEVFIKEEPLEVEVEIKVSPAVHLETVIIKEERADEGDLVAENKLVNTDMNSFTSIIKQEQSDVAVKEEMANDDDSIATEQNRYGIIDIDSRKSPEPNCSRIHKYYCCDICNMKYEQKCDLIEHLRMHNGEVFPCITCKKIYTRARYLKQHMRTHEEEKHTCDLCKKSFNKAGNLKQHYMRIHTDDKPYACDSCDKAFKTTAELKTHTRRHTGEKPYACKSCDKSFIILGHLHRHIRYIHTGEKPYACSVCEKTFSAASNLKRHMLVHTRERPFPCDECEKSFSSTVNLKQHLLSHNLEMPCACKICGSAFSHTAHLREHMLLHRQEKPFACNICDKAFNRAGVLKRHKLVHTGEKPHFCGTCNMAFSQAIHLKQHLLTNKHKDNILGL